MQKRVKCVRRAFPARRPTSRDILTFIQDHQWTCKERDVSILAKTWRPRAARFWTECRQLQQKISRQNWKGMEWSTEEDGRTKVTSCRRFLKGEVICDIHGENISARKGKKIIRKNIEAFSKFLFFYSDPAGQVRCINTSCSCHRETPLKFMRRSRKTFNAVPVYTADYGIVLIAANDIPAKQEITYK